MMLPATAAGLIELHIRWCGSPLNPHHPDHNLACRSAAESLPEKASATR